MTDLIASIKTAGVFALNAHSSHPPTAVLIEDATVCRSDCDSQLIICIPFSAHVRLSGLALRAVAGEEPTVLKLYTDKRELSFDDIESTKANLELKSFEAGTPIALPANKFPACMSVTIFMDAEGKDTVALSRLVLFGSPVETADMTKLTAG